MSSDATNVNSDGSYSYTLLIADVELTDDDPNSYRDTYTISVKAKNSADSTWAYSSYVLYVYSSDALKILVDGLETGGQAYFEMALLFYEKLSGKTDEFLTAHDYSRAEVVDGLKYVVNYYGYGSLLEAFTEDIEI